MKSNVKNPELAAQGKLKIEWVETHMPVLELIRNRFIRDKPFEGITIAMALHVEPKTCALAKTIRDGGAKVAITGCNPLTTQDDAAAGLAEEENIFVSCWCGQTDKEYYENLNKVLDVKPHITIDDGCDLVSLVHTERDELLYDIIGGCEETTTGITRLKAMDKKDVLKYPMMDVNNAYTKHLFDNRYGTGQSTLDGLMSATNLIITGKKFVVVGYGWCGKGIAMRAKGMGCDVIVTEVDEIKAIEAHMDGFRVMTMAQAAKEGEIFVTATGNKHVIRAEHIKDMKEGVLLANAGHFDNEVEKSFLEKYPKRNIRKNVDEFIINEKKVYLLADGRLVNLVAGQGHPAEIMDMSFANQALGAEYLVKDGKKLTPGVYKIPEEIDLYVASLKLETLGIKIDGLTEEQIAYMGEWREGT